MFLGGFHKEYLETTMAFTAKAPRFKRLTAEEREELEQMKTSRFDNKDLKLTYCWWFRNPTNQLICKYPIICRAFIHVMHVLLHDHWFHIGRPQVTSSSWVLCYPWLEMMMAPSVATFFNAVPGADRMFSLKKLPLGMQTWTRRDRSFHHFCIPKNLMWSRSGFSAPLCLTVSTRPCKAHILVTDVLTTSDNILAVYQYQCQHIFATSYPHFFYQQ